MKLLFVLLIITVAVVTAQRDERLFHTRQFWDGLERGISEAGAEVQRRLSSNLETAMDRLTDIGHNIGSLSRRIEDQVEDRLPQWLVPSKSVSPHDAPIEAVVGRFGSDGLGDGLQVYFRGNADQEHLPEPHIIPGEASLFLDSYNPMGSESEAEVLPPRTGGPLLSSPFGRFPLFPRHPLLWTGGIPQPWWKGDNVCVEKKEINEDETDEQPAEPTTEQPLEVTTNPDNKLRSQDQVPDAEVFEDLVEEEEAFASEAEQEEDGSQRTGRFFFGQMEVRSCSDSRDKYTCTTRIRRRGINKTIRQVYRCCHGYVRENNGCTQVNLVPVPESLEGLELTDFLSLAKSAGAVEALNTLNITVFAPSNEAIQDYTADLAHRNDLEIRDNEVYRRKRSTTDGDVELLVNSHLHEGFLYTGDFKDEQVIQSLSPPSTIRINMYRQTVPPTITANCARVTTANQHSSNGVIHTVDRVMQPVTQSIADIISSDPQFTTLKKLVSTSGLLPQLREAEGQYTLLAPTDAAFAALPKEDLDRLLKAEACLPSVLQNHLLPNVICSAAITSPEAKTLNLLEKYLRVRLDDAGKLFVEDSQIAAKDIMATNGVIHIIDAPLLPNEAKPVMQVLRERNLTKFLELLEEAAMVEEMEALQDVTILAPSDGAIDRMAQDIRNDKETLRNALRYHITTSPLQSKDLRNNMHIDTAAGHPLRVNLYNRPTQLFNIFLSGGLAPMTRVTAGCSAVSMRDESRACGASVHIVDTLLTPPQHSVIQHLESSPDFSIIAKIINESSLSEELSGKGPFTILAPSDHVFKTLPQQELDSLLQDQELKDELVKRHVIKEHMCCQGIFPSTHLGSGVHSRTAHGSTLHLHRTNAGLLKAGSARITQCSPVLSNGLVHTVNRLYVEPHMPARQSDFHNVRHGDLFSINLFGPN